MIFCSSMACKALEPFRPSHCIESDGARRESCALMQVSAPLRLESFRDLLWPDSGSPSVLRADQGNWDAAETDFSGNAPLPETHVMQVPDPSEAGLMFNVDVLGHPWWS